MLMLSCATFQDEDAYGGVKIPADGLLVHGLFLDAARFDSEKLILADANPGKKQ